MGCRRAGVVANHASAVSFDLFGVHMIALRLRNPLIDMEMWGWLAVCSWGESVSWEGSGLKGNARATPVSWRWLAAVLLIGALASCANVKPWERGFLADPIMQLGEHPEEDAYEQHMHRALSQGLVGAPAGGGGCGCEQ